MRSESNSMKSLATTVAMLMAVAVLALAAPRPAAADWETSPAADVAASTLDLVIVRPLATVKVIVGAVIFVPAMIVSLPMMGEGISGAYETMIEVPAEYAFDRKIGEL